MKYRRAYLFFIFLIFSLYINAQSKKIETLKQTLKTAVSIPHEVDILNHLSLEYVYTNPDTAIIIIDSTLSIAKRGKYQKGIINALINKGILFYYQGNYVEALRHYFDAMDICKTIKEEERMAAILNNIGLVYQDQSNYPKALEYYFRALSMYEKLNDKTSVATILGNIGMIYDAQSNHSKALEYYYKTLKLAEELGLEELKANTLMNIGIVYRAQANYTQALEYYFKALKIAEQMDIKQLYVYIINNIGIIYEELLEYKLSLEYYLKALKLYEELEDKKGMAFVLNNISSLYLETKKYTLAEKYLKKSIAISDRLGLLDNLMSCEQVYSKLDSIQGNYKGALEHYKRYIAFRDSINNIDKAKKQVMLEMNYNFERERAANRLEQEKKEAIAREEKQRQEIIIYSISVFTLLILVLTVVIFRSLMITKKAKLTIDRQKQALEIQKRLVEEKNQDIIDSINYAKRIQQAILPNEKNWYKKLPNSFILYLPKDIVAGDFYWMEETENYLYVAVADCTGHGVPGAMVSVMCSNALSETVLDDKLTETNAILDRTREIVLDRLSKSDEHIQDGMDICLIRINKKNGKEIQYSGANRPLYIVTNTGELQEIKPDKQPIGNYPDAKPFSKRDIILNDGDSVYLFTDGYADQFGGEKGKKLGNKRLQALILEYASMKIEEQKQAFIEFYNKYKGNQHQIDDITIIGIKNS